MCSLRQPLDLILGDSPFNPKIREERIGLNLNGVTLIKTYAFHVYDLSKEWILTEPKAQTRINSNGNEVITWRFQTFSHEALNPLAELFLTEGCLQMVEPPDPAAA
jgi:hypothetical protein